jgi:adenylate cyclase
LLVAAQAGAAIDNAMAHEKSPAIVAALRAGTLLSPEVVEMVVANRTSELGGVNQEVTVMFADIPRLTAMSEDMEPSRVVEILNNISRVLRT